MAVLPPNTSEADFNNALQAFAAAVGDEWVFSSDEDLKPLFPGSSGRR